MTISCSRLQEKGMVCNKDCLARVTHHLHTLLHQKPHQNLHQHLDHLDRSGFPPNHWHLLSILCNAYHCDTPRDLSALYSICKVEMADVCRSEGSHNTTRYGNHQTRLHQAELTTFTVRD